VSVTRLDGQLSPKDPSSAAVYDGHYVRLEFVSAAESLGQPAFVYPASLTASVETDGKFSFLVDAGVLDQKDARVQVRSPLGTNLAESTLGDVLERDRLRPILVDPELPFQIASHPNRFKGERPRLAIRVFDREGAHDVARRQVLIFATAASPDPQSAPPVLVFTARTDQQGYVSGPYPDGTFAEAFADIDQVRTLVRLEQDGTFPLRLVLVADLPADSTSGATSTLPPRAPDGDDLINSPESFSADLGVGRCIDFTLPNRTLEELPFYKVVRTTDPEIKGTHLEPPIKLPPDFGIWIKQLAFGHDTIDSKLKVRPATDVALELTRSTQPLDATLSPRAVGDTAEAGDAERARAAIAKTLQAPALASLDVSGIREAAQWRAAITASSIDAALNQALPVLSAQMLRSVLVDPDEFTPPSLMTAERLSTHQLLQDLIRVHRKQAPGRAPLDEQNFVDWDDTPTFYQATTIAHGHILQFRQVWKADGYSLGDVLHSIPLAPCQKKQVVTIDWDRREDATRDEDLTEREVLFANLVRDRDVKEMMDTALSEAIDGGSTARTYGGGGGLGFAIGPLVIGAAGGGGGADSEAWQDSSRELSAQSMQELKDRINQSAAAVRSQRATVVQTLSEGERSRVETEVIANHNHCHALTVQYFEVLRHFQVSEELAEVRECLFVPFLMSRFHDAKVLRWREALVRNLLQQSMQPAFDAIERIQLNYVGVDFPLGTFAEEPLEGLDGELQVRITIARPRDPKKDEADYFEKVWPFWPRLIGGNPADVYERYLQNQQFKDRIFRDQLAPQIAERFIASLRVVLIDEGGGEVDANLDPTLASKYRTGLVHMVTLADSGNTPPIARKSIVAVEIRSDYELPENSQVIVEGASFRYHTRHLDHPLYENDRVLDDLLAGDPVYLSTSRLTAEEERNPRAEDLELRRRLLTHLNANVEYYHKAMWWTLDKERRFILLDGFIAPHSSGRSVASVVENDLIGIVGNSLVFPVVAGYQLDPRYRALRDQSDPEKPVPNLFDLYAPITPNPPRLLSVPTKGVFAEAVMGACNSCEKIDESRFWRWSESPCPDDPPPIAEVSTASRAGPTPDLTATNFPAPIVNFQNVPQAPDPGGLAAALALLGRGDLFRDITGLTQNQRNALGALQSSLATAQAFGQEAVQLAHAQAAQRSIDQTLKSLEQAKKDGRLTDDSARDVTKGALQALIGQHGAQSGSSVVDFDSVQAAMSAAADAKKSSVSVKEESAGQQQTVEVSQEGGPGAEGQPAGGPALTGPASVLRGDAANYSLSNVPAGAVVSDWKFTGGGVTINRPGNNNVQNWEGDMVQSGTISVQITVTGGQAQQLTRAVSVTARPWTENAPTIPLGRTGNGALPLQPRVDADLGITNANGAVNISTGVVNSGPNQDFQFVAQPPVTWTVQAFSNEALYDSTHPFNRAHSRSPLPAGRVGLGALQLDVEAHEGMVRPPATAPANFKSHWQRGLDHIAANRINAPRESDVTHVSKEPHANYVARVIAAVEAGVNAVSAATAPHPARISVGTIDYNYPFIQPRNVALHVGGGNAPLILANPGGGTTWSVVPPGSVTLTATPAGATLKPVAAGNAVIRVRNANGDIDEIAVVVNP
jgi:hypothetical protein